ncbi:hypothetical protein BH09BAC1_BH09BAC1_17650 [soil metagenome]
MSGFFYDPDYCFVGMFYVYAISSIERNYIYVGLTSDLEARIERHNNGYEKTTSPYCPFKLIYFEEVEDRPTARMREKYLKSGVGKEFLKSL